MSETKFTPGPWFVTHAATKDGLSRIDDGRTSLERLHPFYLEAWDAHLCAAAPDLYAALETFVLDYAEGWQEAQNIAPPDRIIAARAALAKARGES